MAAGGRLAPVFGGLVRTGQPLELDDADACVRHPAACYSEFSPQKLGTVVPGER